MGILPCISYGGIEKTCPQYQDEFLEARSGSRWTAEGIEKGLRGRALLPSLIRDFGGWMCMRPDMFELTSHFPHYFHTKSQSQFQMAFARFDSRCRAQTVRGCSPSGIFSSAST